MKIRENVSISDLTTMRLGGNARYVVEVNELADVPQVFDFAERGGDLSDGQTTIHSSGPLPVFMLGGGANTIGRDEGFPGIIILNRLKGIEVIDETSDEALVRGMGGEVWDDFVKFCSEKGYSGIEAMSAIPGTVGAAPVQNIGAYGQDMSQVIDHVEAYDTRTHEMVIIGKDEMQMSYRKTIFNDGPDAGRYFIVAVTVSLENGEFLQPPFYNSLQAYLDEHNITDYSPLSIRNAVTAIRNGKLPDPLSIASSGSFFKNVYLSDEEAAAARAKGLKVYDKPDGTHMINTGWLIETAGYKGKVLHGMKVSDEAALVLINESAKSYADLVAAREEIRQAIKEQFGYDIAQEPVEIV